MSLYKKGLEKASSSQNSSAISTEKPKEKVMEKASSFSVKTDIDKFYHLLEISHGKVSLSQVMEVLDATRDQIEDWAKVLERQGLIEVQFSSTGVVSYSLKGRPATLDEPFPHFTLTKTWKLILGLFLLLLVVSLALYSAGIFS